MNLKEIRTEAWAIAREVATTDIERVWTQSEMNQYINRVYRFIARETKCIRDATTSAVCRISVAPPESLAALELLAMTDTNAADDLVEYNRQESWMYQKLVAPRLLPLHSSIIDIDEIKWSNIPLRLTRVSVTKWQSNPFWERICGTPTECCTDYQTGYLVLNYRYTISDTLRLVVRRLPITNLSKDTDVPEFRESYHDFMINGILAQMYSKQDSEVFDPKQVEKYTAMFARDIDEIKQQETIFDQRLKVNNSMAAFR